MTGQERAAIRAALDEATRKRIERDADEEQRREYEMARERAAHQAFWQSLDDGPAVQQTSYLGFPLHVTDTTVTVLDKTGREIGTVGSVKQARLFVRGYRREAA